MVRQLDPHFRSSLFFADRGEAVLIFLPGIQSIEKLNKTLRSRQALSLLNATVGAVLCDPSDPPPAPVDLYLA